MARTCWFTLGLWATAPTWWLGKAMKVLGVDYDSVTVPPFYRYLALPFLRGGTGEAFVLLRFLSVRVLPKLPHPCRCCAGPLVSHHEPTEAE